MTSAVATRRCVHCGYDYQYPDGGGYKRCADCRARNFTHTRRWRTGLYESRVCNRCDRPYLWPVYGGHKVCNDCSMKP